MWGCVDGDARRARGGRGYVGCMIVGGPPSTWIRVSFCLILRGGEVNRMGEGMERGSYRLHLGGANAGLRGWSS